MPEIFFTIGHATRPIEELVGLLHEAGCNMIADVRTMPRSRTNPQFNIDVLPDLLKGNGIEYKHFPYLGGLRGRRKNGFVSPNGFWENTSFRNYADYALTDEFQEGLLELKEVGKQRICAIMCAETVWWRCHRRIITDYLISSGNIVRHILGSRNIPLATLNKGAIPAGRVVLYPEINNG